MNLPTRLTVSRIVMSPIFFVLFFLPYWIGGGAPRWLTYLLLALYLIMELTDLLDGYLARKLDQVTDLGKILDPYSDVVSRITVFVCLAGVELMPLLLLLLVIYRELGIIFLRMHLLRRGVTMGASVWGKLKTVVSSIACGVGVLHVALTRICYCDTPIIRYSAILLAILLYLSVAISIVSFFNYLVRAKRLQG